MAICPVCNETGQPLITEDHQHQLLYRVGEEIWSETYINVCGKPTLDSGVAIKTVVDETGRNYNDAIGYIIMLPFHQHDRSQR